MRDASPPASRRPRTQGGVALVTALLVVSIATVAAATFMRHQALDLRRTSNVIQGDQAWLYIKGAETWAKAILARDQKDSKYDGLDETWATTLPPIELPGGFMTGIVEDMQGRFNINNLMREGKVDPQALGRFERLLESLDLDKELAQAVLDWMDPDIEATPPQGAEDDYYMGLEAPYRTANRPMVHISELRLVKGFDQQIYAKLAPLLTALPTDTAINVNTAPAEVLYSLFDKVDAQALGELIKEREQTPFEKIEDFTASKQLQGAQLNAEAREGLAVSSAYFLVRIETQIGQARARAQSLLFRGDKGDLHVIQRSQAAHP